MTCAATLKTLNGPNNETRKQEEDKEVVGGGGDPVNG